ncbi:MAG: HAD family phosphatase [Candidatus Zapsychrus exili]|nr:HAD family phosphatase [Candidatus Zapsychrus exili]
MFGKLFVGVIPCNHPNKKRAKTWFRPYETNFIVGARTFLKDLKKQGFKLALVTGSAHSEIKKILPERIYNLFEVIVTGSDVKNGKPHPEPYLKAIKALKIKKTQAIVIENAPFGIKSAKTAGLKCYAIETSLPKKYLKQADKIFENIKSLRRGDSA